MSDETLWLSHSQLETFEQCARRWELQKVRRVKQAPSEALVLGDAVHQAIETDGRAAIAGERRLGIPELVSLFSASLSVRLVADDPHKLLRSRENDLRLRGLALLRAYAEQFQAAYRPEEVEAPFPEVTLPSAYSGVPEVRFTGRLDARVGKTIVDFKTASKVWPEGAEHHKPQALAYLWADRMDRGEEAAATQVRFVVLTTTQWERRGETGYLASVDVRVAQPKAADVVGYGARVQRVAQQISAARRNGVFMANPGPLCGWCGVLGSCPIGRRWLAERGRTPAVPMVSAEGRPMAWDQREQLAEVR